MGSRATAPAGSPAMHPPGSRCVTLPHNLSSGPVVGLLPSPPRIFLPVRHLFLSLHTYIHTYIHKLVNLIIHVCIHISCSMFQCTHRRYLTITHTYMHTYMHTAQPSLHSHIYTYIHAYIHTYSPAELTLIYIYTYIHTCIHTYSPAELEAAQL